MATISTTTTMIIPEPLPLRSMHRFTVDEYERIILSAPSGIPTGLSW